MPALAISRSALPATWLRLSGAVVGALLQPCCAFAASAAVPTLSVEATCREAAQRQGPGLRTFDACMADEVQARKALAAGPWRKAKADTRATCLANETVGALASYIDLLTCVQLFEGIVIKPADQSE